MQFVHKKDIIIIKINPRLKLLLQLFETQMAEHCERLIKTDLAFGGGGAATEVRSSEPMNRHREIAPRKHNEVSA